MQITLPHCPAAGPNPPRIVAICLALFGCSGGHSSGPIHDVNGPLAMMLVPGGYFLQGIPEAELDAIVDLCNAHSGGAPCDRDGLIAHHRDETPRRSVHVDAFMIGRTEVTNAAYAACEAAGACSARDFAACTFHRDGAAVIGGELPAAQLADDAPVVCVRWAQAVEHCAWTGGRLPSEAEWEKAARGVDGRRFPWGDIWDPSKASWYDDELGSVDGWPSTAPVGSFPAGASPYGALDMAGNVWEWVADAPVASPGAEASGELRMARGGGYAAKPIALRTTKRIVRSGEGYDNVGFRCVR